MMPPFNSGMYQSEGHRLSQAADFGQPPSFVVALKVPTVPVAVHSFGVATPRLAPLPPFQKVTPKVHDGRGSFGAIQSTRVGPPRFIGTQKILRRPENRKIANPLSDAQIMSIF